MIIAYISVDMILFCNFSHIKLFLFLILMCQQLLHNVSSKLISCEGFIRSSVPIDLSSVQMKLFTVQGNLKHESPANPENGYFLIPIYNKGKFFVKINAPEGWIFVPDHHKIEITDDDSNCSDELNFELYGFKISGTVLNSQGTSLSLGLYEENGKLIESTSTDEKGHYSFVTKPGIYAISPISGSDQCMDQGRIKLEVTNSPFQIKPDIRIAGHNLMVRADDERGKPMAGVTVTLYADQQVNFENLPINAEKPLAEHSGKQWMYSLKTDGKGITLFHCIPNANYKISARMEKPGMKLNFDEKSFEINSKTHQVVIALKTFTLSGQVATKLSPIAGAKIILDGSARGESDADGNFQLENINPGKHVVEARKEHFEFEKVEVDISFTKADNFPAIKIVPSRLAICGKVSPAEKLDSIMFELVNSVDGKVLDKMHPDGQGKFCKMLEPRKYTFRAISSISIAPKELQVDLVDKPLLDLKFTQYKANVEGRVQCFRDSCNKVRLELWQKNQLHSQMEVPPSGQFQFTEIPPSKYILKISDAENIWWDQTEKQIEVVDKDLRDIKFMQKGFTLEVKSNRPTKLKYYPESESANSKSIVELPLVEGVNFINFPAANKFAFSLDSCYEFRVDGAIQNTFSVPSTKPVLFTAISSSISILANTEEDDLEKDASLSLVLREKASGIEHQPRQVRSSKRKRNFEFNLSHAKVGQQFQVVPKSDRLLFSPEEFSFTFDGNCNDQLTSFQTQIGKFIQGSVEPAVAEAIVTARHRTKQEIVLTSSTDKSGKYKIGPVWKVEDFTMEMSREGFEFQPKPGNANDFASVKLSQLNIQFLDSATKTPLADVLVSISGGSNFRSNNVTKPTGVLNFIGLAPGSYYIRPILQEYKFNSSSFTVQIVEGQTQELILEAKRFAYSIFGKVSSIGSKPHRIPIRIEAVSTQCENHQEEDLLDLKTDQFRIRGLKPECEYRISLKDSEDREIKSFPPLINAKTGTEDKHGITFMLLPSDQPKPVVIGQLELAGGSIPPGGFRVALSAGNNVLQEQAVQSPASVFFFDLPAHHQEYKLSVDRIETKQAKIEAFSISFMADSPFNFVRLVPRSEQRAREVEVLKANYFGLALIALITLAFLNQSKTKSIFDYLVNFMQTFINQRQEWTSSGPVDESRRKKPKKS